MALAASHSPYHNRNILFNFRFLHEDTAYQTTKYWSLTSLEPGKYFFTFSIGTYGNHKCAAYLRKNVVIEGMAYVQGSSSVEMASNTVVLYLDAGDRVYIQTSSCDYIYGKPYSMFSGWKIKWIDFE